MKGKKAILQLTDLLIWRDAIQLRRRPFLSILLLILPILLAILPVVMFVTRGKNGIVSLSQVNRPYRDYDSLGFVPSEKDLDDIPSKLAYTPVNDLTRKIMKKTKENLFAWLSLQEFPNESALEEALKNKDKEYFGGIAFTSINDDEILPENLEYKIRVFPSYHGAFETGRRYMAQPRLAFRKQIHKEYYTSGFLSLQVGLERAILSILCVQDHFNYSIRAVPMNFPKLHTDLFYEYLSIFAPVFIVLSFLIYGIAMTVDIARDKEQRIKEKLNMLGVPNIVIWLTYFMKYFIFVLVMYAVLCITLLINASMLGPVIGGTSSSLVMSALLLYMVSSMMFTFAISTFFSTSSVAGLMFFVISLTSFVPTFLIFSDPSSTSSGVKGLLCLFPNTAIYFVLEIIVQRLENQTPLSWENYTEPVFENQISFQVVMVMLFVDSIIYMLIAWYFENVNPSSGSPRPLWFPFTKVYWVGGGMPDQGHALTSAEAQNLDLIQPLPVGTHIGIQTQRLTKEYIGPWQNVAAVSELDMTVVEGHITVVLGPPGSGKSTMVSLLTCATPPTSGSASVGGYDITKEQRGVHSILGCCPKENVCVDYLNVKENLKLFGCLKGIPYKDLPDYVRYVLTICGLRKNRRTLAENLPKSQLRMLSFAIAILGNPQVLILDEPTLGMDPKTRRLVWRVLKKMKKGRTILVTTQHEHEAESLGDRIAILSNGLLHCCGSVKFLHEHYTAGYHISVRDIATCKPGEIDTFVKKHMPNALLDQYSVSEMVFWVPEENSDMIYNLFNKLKEARDEIGTFKLSVNITSLAELYFRVVEEDEVDIRQMLMRSNQISEIKRRLSSIFRLGRRLTSFFEAGGSAEAHQRRQSQRTGLVHYKDMTSTSMANTGHCGQQGFVDNESGSRPYHKMTNDVTHQSDNCGDLIQNANEVMDIVEPTMDTVNAIQTDAEADPESFITSDVTNPVQGTDPVLEPLSSNVNANPSDSNPEQTSKDHASTGIGEATTSPVDAGAMVTASNTVDYSPFSCPETLIATSTPAGVEGLCSSTVVVNVAPEVTQVSSSPEKQSEVSQEKTINASTSKAIEVINQESVVVKTPALSSGEPEIALAEQEQSQITKDLSDDSADIPAIPSDFDHQRRISTKMSRPVIAVPFKLRLRHHFQQIKSLLVKMAMHSYRKPMETILKLAVPLFLIICFSIGAVALGYSSPHDGSSVSLTLGDYEEPYVSVICSGERGNLFADAFLKQFQLPVKSQNVPRFKQSTDVEDRTNVNFWQVTRSYMLSGMFEDDESKGGNGVSMEMFFNSEPFHLEPIAYNAIHNTILKATPGLGEYTLVATNQPLPTPREKTPMASGRVMVRLFVTISCMIIASILPALFGTFRIRENVLQSKQMQFIYGVRPLTYHFTSYFFDFMFYMWLLLLMVCIFTWLGPSTYQADKLGVLVLAITLFGYAVFPFVYLLSNTFNSIFGGTQMLIINFGLCSMIPFSLVKGAEDYVQEPGFTSFLSIVFQIFFPHYNLARTVWNVSLLGEGNHFDWDLVGGHLFFLFFTGSVLWISLIQVEYHAKEPSYQCFGKTLKPQVPTPSSLAAKDVDGSVSEEARQVMQKHSFADDAIVFQEVTKQYESKIAINNLTLAAPNGSCVGILGLNKAGKTTIFKLLTGMENATRGSVFVKGYDVATETEDAVRFIGYCPQNEQYLFSWMTCAEILRFYGRLRGISEPQLQQSVSHLITSLGIDIVGKQQIGDYGRAKRRLVAIAVAFVGDPQITLLDCPTAFLDPVSKKLVRALIKTKIASGSTVIMSSRNMSECEELCSNICILVDGSFRCIGSPENLRNRYCNGFSVDIRMLEKDAKSLHENGPVREYMSITFPGCRLINRSHEKLVFQIPESRYSWADVHQAVKAEKERLFIDKFYVAQASLAHLFMSVTSNDKTI